MLGWQDMYDPLAKQQPLNNPQNSFVSKKPFSAAYFWRVNLGKGQPLVAQVGFFNLNRSARSESAVK
jgi:hypothetical protein